MASHLARCATGEINARYHFKRINVNDAYGWINATVEYGVEQIRVLTLLLEAMMSIKD